MFGFLDRRKLRLEKLTLLVNDSSDRALTAALLRCGPEEVAFALSTLSLERANGVLAIFPPDQLKAALVISKAGAGPSDKMISRFAEELTQERAYGSVNDSDVAEVPIAAPAPQPGSGLKTPISIKALDFAGRVFGTHSLDTEAEPSEGRDKASGVNA